MRKLSKINKVALKKFNFHMQKMSEYKDCELLVESSFHAAMTVCDLMTSISFQNKTYNKYVPLWQRCSALALSKRFPKKRTNKLWVEELCLMDLSIFDKVKQ